MNGMCDCGHPSDEHYQDGHGACKRPERECACGAFVPGTPQRIWPTKNSERAKAWVRVINVWLYNLPTEHVANIEDFERHFPRETGLWRSANSPGAISTAKNELRALRDDMIQTFDIPADGGARWP